MIEWELEAQKSIQIPQVSACASHWHLQHLKNNIVVSSTLSCVMDFFWLLIFSICVTDLFDSVYRHFKDCECLLFLELMVNVLCNVTSYCCSTRDRYHGTREEVLDLKVCDKNWQIWFGNIHSSSVTTNSTVFMSR